MSYTVGQKIRAVYWTGVYKPNIIGFRAEKVTAELKVISPGRARVIRAKMEPAHSNRQWFDVSYAAMKEIGTVKIISRLSDVEVIE